MMVIETTTRVADLIVGASKKFRANKVGDTGDIELGDRWSLGAARSFHMHRYERAIRTSVERRVVELNASGKDASSIWMSVDFRWERKSNSRAVGRACISGGQWKVHYLDDESLAERAKDKVGPEYISRSKSPNILWCKDQLGSFVNWLETAKRQMMAPKKSMWANLEGPAWF